MFEVLHEKLTKYIPKIKQKIEKFFRTHSMSEIMSQIGMGVNEYKRRYYPSILDIEILNIAVDKLEYGFWYCGNKVFDVIKTTKIYGWITNSRVYGNALANLNRFNSIVENTPELKSISDFVKSEVTYFFRIIEKLLIILISLMVVLIIISEIPKYIPTSIITLLSSITGLLLLAFLLIVVVLAIRSIISLLHK